MAKYDCEVCRGAGLIRLPLYRRADVRSAPAFESVVIDESIRQYPCPECSDTVPQDRLAIVQYHSLVDSRFNDPEFIAYAKEKAAHGLVASLLEGGFIRLDHGRSNDRKMQYELRAYVGVVSLKHVATLEQRIAERQDELAREVAEEAARQIRMWKSNYTKDEGNISKGQAVDFVNTALKTVLAKLGRTKLGTSTGSKVTHRDDP